MSRTLPALTSFHSVVCSDAADCGCAETAAAAASIGATAISACAGTVMPDAGLGVVSAAVISGCGWRRDQKDGAAAAAVAALAPDDGAPDRPCESALAIVRESGVAVGGCDAAAAAYACVCADACVRQRMERRRGGLRNGRGSGRTAWMGRTAAANGVNWMKCAV